MGSDAMMLVFWMLSFKPTFSLRDKRRGWRGTEGTIQEWLAPGRVRDGGESRDRARRGEGWVQERADLSPAYSWRRPVTWCARQSAAKARERKPRKSALLREKVHCRREQQLWREGRRQDPTIPSHRSWDLWVLRRPVLVWSRAVARVRVPSLLFNEPSTRTPDTPGTRQFDHSMAYRNRLARIWPSLRVVWGGPWGTALRFVGLFRILQIASGSPRNLMRNRPPPQFKRNNNCLLTF